MIQPEFTNISIGPDPAKAGDPLSITFEVSEPLQSNPTVVKSDSVLVMAYTPVLTEIIVSPDTVRIDVGDSRRFVATGRDQQNQTLAFSPVWSATGGTIDAQENPLANTVTYGVHNYHPYHSITNHLYLSRPIFLHRQSYDSWPAEIQEELRAAIVDAVAVQRVTKTQEELDPTLNPELLYAEGGFFNFGFVRIQPLPQGGSRFLAEVRAEDGETRPGSVLELE